MTSSTTTHAASEGKTHLDAFVPAVGHCAVVGLQWGDEGKGKMVDLLTRHFDIVARYNGGANAGHSVVVGDERYALHLIPSGILYGDKTNVIGNGVVVDPQKLLEEVTGLRERGVTITGANLRISDRAHVVLPYHKVQDVLYDQAVTSAKGTLPIGTTGRGIGPCYADKALRSTAIRMGELVNPAALRDKLTTIVSVKNAMLGAIANEVNAPFEPFDAQALYELMCQWSEQLSGHICDTSHLLHESIAGGKRILFEGANATLLDIDHGTYPFVTSSNCSSLGVHTGTGIPGHMVGNIVGIMKAYQTRVGGGPMPTELTDAIGDRIREQGREYGTTTGRPRRCGWLDTVAVRYSARLSGATAIAIMLLDVLRGVGNLKLCVGYKVNGQELANFPACADVLNSVEPMYEEMPGFDEPIEDVKTYDALPQAARDYIERIETIVGVPIKAISVGPKRTQTIVR